MTDNGPRVLIVEGQSRLRRALSQMLSESGASLVRQASDDAAAKQIIWSMPVDLVICDWISPSFDGLEFLRKIRSTEFTKFIPLMLMSGVGRMEEDDYSICKDFDVDNYVFTPVNQDDLREKVSSTIENYQAMSGEITHLLRAGAYIDVKAYDEARGELQSIEKKEPALPRIWTDMGVLYEGMGSHDVAKSCFQKAISLDKDYARPYEGLGSVLWKEGNLEKAGQCFEIATRISPRNSKRQFMKAKLLLERGDLVAAQAAVYRALEGKDSLGGRNAEAAEFFLSNGHPDMAEKEYTLALEKSPQNLKYYNRLGIAFRRQKKWKEALEVYKKALKFSPRNTVIFYNMARSLVEEGKIGQAESAIRQALAIEPHFKEAQEFLQKLASLRKK